MVAKRILCPDRLRRVPKKFSWVDHALVQDKHLRGLSHGAMALYLFLVTVGDADGLSYYGDATLMRHLRMDTVTLGRVRVELCRAGLIAYCCPLYQVLSLEQAAAAGAPRVIVCDNTTRHAAGDLTPIGDIIRQMLGGTP
jgi:hypothetical protein